MIIKLMSDGSEVLHPVIIDEPYTDLRVVRVQDVLLVLGALHPVLEGLLGALLTARDVLPRPVLPAAGTRRRDVARGLDTSEAIQAVGVLMGKERAGEHIFGMTLCGAIEQCIFRKLAETQLRSLDIRELNDFGAHLCKRIRSDRCGLSGGGR